MVAKVPARVGSFSQCVSPNRFTLLNFVFFFFFFFNTFSLIFFSHVEGFRYLLSKI